MWALALVLWRWLGLFYLLVAKIFTFGEQKLVGKTYWSRTNPPPKQPAFKRRHEDEKGGENMKVLREKSREC